MDKIHNLLFQDLPVRGTLVQLETSWQQILQRRAHHNEWPPILQSLMGQMAAASLLLHSSIRFDGKLILQIQGDGPLKLAVAESRPTGSNRDKNFRATAKCIGALAPDASLRDMANQNGKGQCVLTLDPHTRKPGQQPYQGIVALQTEPTDADHTAVRGPLSSELALALEEYMRQSEQLDTTLLLAADGEHAAGLLIQRLPSQGSGNLSANTTGQTEHERLAQENEHMRRIATLAASVQREELLHLDPSTLLRRLFWQEPLQIVEEQNATFACTCSDERIAHMLHNLGQAEINSILAERGAVDIDCDFCGTHYHLDPIQCAALFTPISDLAPSSDRIQ